MTALLLAAVGLVGAKYFLLDQLMGNVAPLLDAEPPGSRSPGGGAYVIVMGLYGALYVVLLCLGLLFLTQAVLAAASLLFEGIRECLPLLCLANLVIPLLAWVSHLSGWRLLDGGQMVMMGIAPMLLVVLAWGCEARDVHAPPRGGS